MTAKLNYEPGSYRDRDGRVFYDPAGGICRSLSTRALAEWEIVSKTKFFRQAIEDGRIVATHRLNEIPPSLQESDAWAGALTHQRVPFVTYPFEWSFSMLQDAALLHLDLLQSALDEDITLKDGTAYNVQWFGTQPAFIDVVSFERLVAGKPWAGYRQFCQTFLYPLLLQAYKNVPFHPWLRGRLDGITPQECWSLMSIRDLFRGGVTSHVWLHAWLQSRRSIDAGDASKALKSAGFGKELIRANVAGLKKLIRRLRWSPRESSWSEYADANSYSTADRVRKEEFVRQAVNCRHRTLVWDLGCNTGNFSRIAAENSDVVIAMDSDHLAIDRLYQSLKSHPDNCARTILPLVNNVADPSGGLGWRGTERRAIVDRGRPELTLCLALVHHLVIGNGIPLEELLTWLAGLGTGLVIEFVTKEDAMVRRLLRGRHDNYSDYEQTYFERLLNELFHVVNTAKLDSGTRVLYYAESRSPS
jgi:hypothetical protein